MYLFLGVGDHEHITRVIETAKRVAGIIGLEVDFEFNDVYMEVFGDTDVTVALAEFDRKAAMRDAEGKVKN